MFFSHCIVISASFVLLADALDFNVDDSNLREDKPRSYKYLKRSDSPCYGWKPTSWGTWEECQYRYMSMDETPCGFGTRKRMRLRYCANEYHIEECEKKPCNQNNLLWKQEADGIQQSDEYLRGSSIEENVCPPSHWSLWSPCSNNCGHGVKVRTGKRNCKERIDFAICYGHTCNARPNLLKFLQQ